MQLSSLSDLVKANKKSLVVYSERLTPEGEPVISSDDVFSSDRCIYRLEDGSSFVLLSEEIGSLYGLFKWKLI